MALQDTRYFNVGYTSERSTFPTVAILKARIYIFTTIFLIIGGKLFPEKYTYVYLFGYVYFIYFIRGIH